VTLCSERSGKVAKKRRYTKEFQRMAVGRMKVCDSVTTLAEELGVPRQLLYVWRDRQEARENRPAELPPEAEPELAEENRRLKRLLADKTLEIDFFKGALQKIETRRQRANASGTRASTTKSGK
jgi:transposase-like protein